MKNRRAFELRLGKLGLVLFVCGMSVLLFSMFLLGAVVGKHMEAYPERFSEGIAELIYDRLLASVTHKDRMARSDDMGKTDLPAGQGDDFSLTFYDTLGGKKAKKQVTRRTDTENPPQKKSSQGAGETGNIPGTGLSDTPVAGKPDRMPVPVGGVTPNAGTAVEKGRFEIQVAAYRESKRAERMIDRLKPLGFAPRLVIKDLPGKGKWFRVVIGGFENREKAKQTADHISMQMRGVKCVIRSTGNRGGGR